MTEGRLETVHNMRPQNWDNRRHWTNWHHLYDCEEDHIARESAPFHDLRAGGQFQYEYSAGGGPYAAQIPAASLATRAAGDRMDFAKGPGTNMGGLGQLPFDTEPGMPVKPNTLPRQRAIRTNKAPLKRGLFSDYPHLPEGDGDKGPSPRSGGLQAGKRCDFMGATPEYIPDPHQDRPLAGRVGHFRTGSIKHNYPAWMPQGEPERKPRRTYGAFRAGKPGTLSIEQYPEWIPDPHEEPKLRSRGHPFRTWHTSTKWSMPVQAPWTAGLTTAEPRMGANLDVTETGLPSLRNTRKGGMAHTIGSEAALATVASRK